MYFKIKFEECTIKMEKIRVFLEKKNEKTSETYGIIRN